FDGEALFIRRQRSAAERDGPPEDRRERALEFVRKNRQKLLFMTIGTLGLQICRQYSVIGAGSRNTTGSKFSKASQVSKEFRSRYAIVQENHHNEREWLLGRRTDRDQSNAGFVIAERALYMSSQIPAALSGGGPE